VNRVIYQAVNSNSLSDTSSSEQQLTE